MKKAAFIGAGNMGGALIRAACRAIGPDEVLIADHQPEKAAELDSELSCTAAATNDEALRGAETVFLCVKPQVLPTMLEALRPALARRSSKLTMVSIAAGVRLADIRRWLGSEGETIPLLRVMPNTCA